MTPLSGVDAATGSVVVVGSTMRDMSTYCERFPEDGETLVGSGFKLGFGGKGANQAVMAARVGCKVAFVGRVGDDQTGIETVANLQHHGVDGTWLLPTPGATSGVAPIWVDAHGANRILVIPGANDELTSDDVVRALRNLPRPDVILAQLETPQAATIAAFRIGQQSTAVSILNPAPAAAIDPELLARVDWMVPNESEFETLWGAPPTPRAALDAGEEWGCGVVVTRGAAGALVANDGEITEIPAPPARAVDTTGAGDAFVGAFAAALALGGAPATAARLGCTAGSLSVAGAGTQKSFPGRNDLLASSDLLVSSDPFGEEHQMSWT